MAKTQLNPSSPAFVPTSMSQQPQQYIANNHHHPHPQQQNRFQHAHQHHHHHNNISNTRHTGNRGHPVEPKRDPCAILVFHGHVGDRRREAKRIAEKMNYLLISDENYTESECPFVELSNAIVKAKASGPVNGFVIEGFLLVHHTEIHYLNHMLEENQVPLKGVIYIDDGDYKYCTADVNPWERTSYPINFEVCKTNFDHLENFLFLAEFDADECFRIFKDAHTLQTISLSVTPTHGLKLLSNKYLFNDMKKQVHELLLPPEITDRKWSLPICTPCREMDYNQFTRNAHDLKSYFVTYDLEGERCLLVKFRGIYYLYMSNCASAQIVDEEMREYFTKQLSQAGTIKEEALKARSSDFFEATEARRRENPDIECVFEVTTFETKDETSNFAVADMLYFYGALGSEMLFEERNHVVKSVCDSKGSFITLKWYRLDQIAEIASKNKEKFTYGGLIFAHPGTYYASFCKKGFVYKYHDCATADVRIWNGREAKEHWEFEAFVTGGADEEPEVSINVPAYCGLDQANEQVIMYGHIVRIGRKSAGNCRASNPQPAVKNGKKDQHEKRTAPTTEWEVKGRREWSSNPVSAQLCVVMKDRPLWSRKGLEDAMKSLFEIEEH